MRANRSDDETAASRAGRPCPRPLASCALVVLLALALGAAGTRSGRAESRPWAAKDAPSAPGPRRSVTWVTRTMGTYVQIALATPDSAAAWPDARMAQEVFRRVDSLMSNWTTTSEVARLNRVAASGPTRVHPEVATVLDASLRIWRESDGAFDITVEPLIRAWGFIGGPRRVPTDIEIAAALSRVGARQLRFDPTARTLGFARDGVKIDLGGIAKGYAVDVAAESLRAHGVSDALVNLSGNMVALGKPVDAAGWRIGVRDPRDRLPYLGRLTLSGEAISTSGQYEQFIAGDGKTYGHIMNPRTGRPSEGLISVTVVAPSAMETDGWDTPLFVLGPIAARRKARQLDRIDAILVQPGTGGVDTMWVEETLRDRFLLEPRARSFIQLRYF